MSVTPRHKFDGFYKYYTARSAKLTLANTTRKWSTPALFNDPFDNQFNIAYEEPSRELAATHAKRLDAFIRSNEPITAEEFGEYAPKIALLRQALKDNPDFAFSEDEQNEIIDSQLEGMQNVIKWIPKANAEIAKIMANVSIFCVSETHDNLLMWSHYAENHTGAVIKFLALPDVDSPLLMAQPVHYSEHFPRLEFTGLRNSEEARRRLYEMITLTKSHVWAYEKEWRVVGGLRDKSQTHELLPYAPEEVGEVYLGCKMSTADREEIMMITRSRYKAAKIFQAEKHDTEYELRFKRIF